MVKAGVRTSEFWVMLIQALVGPVVILSVSLGWFAPEVSDEVTSDIREIIVGVLAIIANINSVRAVKAYTVSRTEIKKKGDG